MYLSHVLMHTYTHKKSQMDTHTGMHTHTHTPKSMRAVGGGG